MKREQNCPNLSLMKGGCTFTLALFGVLFNWAIAGAAIKLITSALNSCLLDFSGVALVYAEKLAIYNFHHVSSGLVVNLRQDYFLFCLF